MGRLLKIWVVFFLIPLVLFGSPITYKFQKYTIHEGLSNNWVDCLIKDSRGLMWFGTRNGLCKYDGYSFTNYFNDYHDSSSISGNRINCLIEDPSGNIWVGTNQNGLNRYDRWHDRFDLIALVTGQESSISIHSLQQMADGKIWIGTFRYGIRIYDPKTNAVTPFEENVAYGPDVAISDIEQDEKGFIWIVSNGKTLDRFDPMTGEFFQIPIEGLAGKTSENIFEKRLYVDRDGNLWIGSGGNGMWVYQPTTRTFTHYTMGIGKGSINNNSVMDFAEVGNDNMWIATDNGGINILNKKTNQFSYIMAHQNDPYALNSNGIYAILVDESNRIWLATFDGGVNMYDKKKYQFDHFYHWLNQPQSISHNNVISLCDGLENTIWVGTDGGGLNLFHVNTGTFEKPTYKSTGFALDCPFITALCLDKKKRLWVAGFQKGLSRINLRTSKIRHYQYQEDDSCGLPINNIWAIYEDGNGVMWFGTLGAGLLQYDEANDCFIQFSHHPQDPHSISDQYVTTLLEDGQNRFWIGLEGGGLNMMDRETGQFLHYMHDDLNSSSLSDNCVNGILESIDGTIWITTSNGLNRLNNDNKSFTIYRKSDGLPNNRIFDILQSDDGLLWLSTDGGLVRLDPQTGATKTYFETDGLQSNQFSQTACLKSRDGRLYFGGVEGLTRFFPDSIQQDCGRVPVVLTDFEVYNHSVSVGDDHSPLTTHISEAKQVILSYHQQVFSIEFAALEYTSPEKVVYRYKMQGFDTDWRSPSENVRRATYTNLAGGSYTFRIQASCCQGEWGPEKTLRIIVHPPFWKTWWFKTLVILIVLTAVFLVYYLRTKEMHQRNLSLAEINRKLNKEIKERKEAEDMLNASLVEKVVLLKEIHHRVKNNMQVICSLLSLQKDSLDNPELLETFQESQNRVRSMALIHEKLYQSDDLAHIHFGDYIKQLVGDLVRSYHTADQKIQLDVNTQDVELPVSLAVPCGLIINELVSNAIKYAFKDMQCSNCLISIQMSQDDGRMILIVEDNGVGLPPSIDLKETDSLGLYLVRILSEDQLNGHVTIVREKGTRFEIVFNANIES